MRALIDGDILRYEIGFGAEAWWKAITEGDDAIPPWSLVEELLHKRIDFICDQVGATSSTLFLSEGRCFRYDVAKTVPYKSGRVGSKPWHYNNLGVYMTHILKADISTELEADDTMAIEHCRSKTPTIIYSRDKDLRQIPGWFYCWEAPNQGQPSFGPVEIREPGTLDLKRYNNKTQLVGTGHAWFCAQMLTGDRVDSIPGLPGWGPVAAHRYLTQHMNSIEELDQAVRSAYEDKMGHDWEPYHEEQKQLLWIIR